MTATADVLVIGAGIVGCSTALELSRRGLDVLVLDKAGAPGMGSTSASSAIIRFNYSTWAGVAIAWESKFRWERWEEHLGHRDPNGLARFHRTGKLLLDVPLIPRQRMAALFDQAGIPYEVWDADTLAARVPGIDTGAYYPPKPVGSDAFFDEPRGRLGAVFTPDGGFVDDPRLAAANLAAAAVRRGARFAFRRRVTSIDRTGDVWRTGLDGRDTVEAPVLVNAAGPWSSRVNELAGAAHDFTVDVRPMRQEVHHTAAPPALRHRFPVIADLDLGVYFRPDTGGNLLVGGTEPECDPLQWIDDPDTVDLNATVPLFEAQLTRAARRLPDLTVPNRPRGIAGVYDVARDWTPIYDRTARPGFYVAIGTSGNQFKNAPVIGSLLDAIIDAVENGHDHDAEPVRYTCAHTGHEVDLGAFSRRRPVNTASSGTVMG
ncbi:FAD-dependent oxidoreductase [Virgisporangium aliadipatigenens]|uniref:FAD-dependent oxidoreductase n=1 Tax=Virgisporangium aliadipatigenens TaxID=741659 RepID=A0A8J3YJX1_9ACTN|nr:FAD-dependent oxidoreductase [Virgisporangium aliadipatigenens]GIJ45291.1 FAD-dependent oxidoreductase [Virgisporangium aliadipatigenens]